MGVCYTNALIIMNFSHMMRAQQALPSPYLITYSMSLRGTSR